MFVPNKNVVKIAGAVLSLAGSVITLMQDRVKNAQLNEQVKEEVIKLLADKDFVKQIIEKGVEGA